MVVIFPMDKMTSKMKSVCKIYGWSNFRSTREIVNHEERRGILKERHMAGSRDDKWYLQGDM